MNGTALLTPHLCLFLQNMSSKTLVIPRTWIRKEVVLKYKERVERLPQQDRLSKFCTGAGFLQTVEVGQYFMTKDTA